MRFDLEQLFQSPVRDLVLDQLTKNLGQPREGANKLLDKALSLIFARMARKSLRRDSASTLYGLLKNSSFSVDPASLLSEQSSSTPNQVEQLVEQGKQLIPALFVSKTQGSENYLANTTNMPAGSVKTTLGLLIPIIFSFFKDKIENNGLNLTRMTGFIGDQKNNIAPFIDQGALDALGIKGTFDDLFLALDKAPALFIAGTSSAGSDVDYSEPPVVESAASTPNSHIAEHPEKKSIIPWKFLIPVAVLLAGLLVAKSCTTEETKTEPATPTATSTQASTNAAATSAAETPASTATPAEQPPTAAASDTSAADSSTSAADNNNAQPAEPAVQTTQGLGNLAWAVTDKDITVSGKVQNTDIKNAITSQLKTFAGSLPLNDQLQVDAQAPVFAFENFAGLSEALKNFPEISGRFDDTRLELQGLITSAEEKNDLIQSLQSVLGNAFTVQADAVTIESTQAPVQESPTAEQTPSTEASSQVATPEPSAANTPVDTESQAAPTPVSSESSHAASTEVVEEDAAILSDMTLAQLDLNIQFDTGLNTIKPRYHKMLNAFAQYLQETGKSGEIAGYTDNVGDAQANQALSQARAEAVRDYLIAQGVKAEQLNAMGHGQENPRADNSTEEGRAQNRRIEFNAK